MAHRRPKGPKPWLPPPDRPARILLVRLSALGDVLHALPVLAALRARLPDAHLGWAVEDRAAGLLEARPDLDAIHVFPRRALREALRPLPRSRALGRSLRAFLRPLRDAAYDVALDLQGNLKSGAVLRASGAGVRFGFARPVAREGNQLFSTHRAAPPAQARHHVERGLALAGAMLGTPLPYVPPGFPTTPAQDAEAAALLDGVEDVAVLHPGTSAFGAFKRWPADRFAALARRLAADGLTPLVTHGPDEVALAEAVVGRCGDAARAVGPSSLGALAAVMREARLVVAADTGPLHLATLVETPVLGLFGPKDPAVYGPYGRRQDGSAGVLDVHVREDVACRPCSLRRCPDPLCMGTMAPEAVHAHARRLLAT